MADLRTSVPPQLAQATSTTSIMLDVIVALIPALGMSVYLFGPRVLALTLISVGACVLSEYLYRRLTHQSNTLRDCSACVTGLLLAMCLPAASPYWVPLLGGVFAIVVVKQFYGGLGKNFMNPALAGRMLLSTFPFLMTTWVDALDYLPVWGEMDAVTSPTPMAALHSGRLPELDMGQMLLGQHGGSIGEVSIFMLLLGGLYLIATKVISPTIPVTYLATVAVLSLVSGRDPIYQLLSGGLILGAFFMATDYVTSPTTEKGKLVFGIGLGVITCLIRFFGTMNEGVSFAILLMNLLVPYIEVLTRQDLLGISKPKKNKGGAAK